MKTLQNFLYATLALFTMAMGALSAETTAPTSQNAKETVGLRSAALSQSPLQAAVPDAGPFAAGQWSVSPFTGWTTPDLKLDKARQFTGLGLGYQPVRNIELAGELAAWDVDKRAIDQVGVHGRGYLPLWKTGFATYGELGWQRFTGDRRDFLSVGAGVALRAKRAGARLGLRKLDDFKRGDLLQVLLAAELRF